MPEYDFKLTAAEVDLIGAALGKLPLEQSIGLFAKLKAQYNAQAPKADGSPFLQ